MSFYASMVVHNKTTYLRDPNQHGRWIDVGSKRYVFSLSANKKNFTESLSACCSIGMKLISLHQDFLFDTLINASSALNETRNNVFWTSATDAGCAGYLGYCSTNHLIRNEAKWASGQPDNTNGTKHCVAVEVTQSSSYLFMEDCNKNLQYACEGRSKMGSLSGIVEEECRIPYRLSKEETNKSLSSQPQSMNEKCFIKCFGEGMGLYVNGKLKEELIYAQIPIIAANDDQKLMESYTVMEMCTNMTKGMDECNQAAELLKCGQENAPVALASLMNNLEALAIEFPVPLPSSTAVCPNNYICNVNEELKISFDLKKDGDVLITNFGSGTVKHICNKKYYIVDFPQITTIINALENCCLLGLRLATIDTKSEHDCLVANNITTSSNLVAASMLGNIGHPIWCFSDKPFNATWFNTDLVTSEPNPARFTVNLALNQRNSIARSWSDDLARAICQSV
ncbi:uncharacterized protein LOC132205728 [Neocloeon triangulifer]|uniref:uncharacterized protein LOC132205728 n=1 Tax=Neocloeon triangulifer TaxID=2078957 RepID=UPI00286F3F4C|nr:uncharacterized protein LOC132205728 [Neocloeon triangulifer]